MTAYDIVYALAIGATAPIWLLVPKLRRKILDALSDRNGTVPGGDPTRPAILLHAVSMGEINATTALVRQLSEAMPQLRFIVSTTSRTGNARATELYAKNPDVTRIRFPFDFSRYVTRMLDAQRPKLAVLMELEIWPNFMRECRRRNIPVVLVNGRLSAHSFRNYSLAGLLIHPMFGGLRLACVQEQNYADRFARLGVAREQIRVTGTMKFDTAQIADRIDGADILAQSVGLHPGQEKIWVCGSTGPGEEDLVLSVFAELRQKTARLRLVLVPRHPERFDEVARLIQSRGLPVIRRSQPQAGDSTAVILGDTMGELRKFYSLADVVFVGRSLIDLGPKQHGSDMIEPAALAKPVIVGPFTGNFTEVMNRFREAGAIQEVRTADELRDAVESFLGDERTTKEISRRAQDVVRANQGATRKHVETILRLLNG